MIDELHAKFRPQFIALARQRVTTASSAVVRRDHAATSTTVRELHSLVGEAGLLGLDAVVAPARAAEQTARRWLRSRDDGDADALTAALAALSRLIDELA